MKALFVLIAAGLMLPAAGASESQSPRESASVVNVMKPSGGTQPLPLASPAEVGLSAERLERVSRHLERAIAGEQIAGAVFAIARRGRLVRLEALGKADVEAGRSMRADDIFRIASMSKPVTSVAALVLLEEQRLLLNDPLEKFVPEFRQPKVAVTRTSLREGHEFVPAERSITVHDLLTHRAGLPTDNGPMGAQLRERLSKLPPDAVLEDWVRALTQVPLNAQPGERWQYGYATDVLGRVIEVASGQTLDAFLRARIFEPLGMVDTGFGVPMEKRARLTVIYSTGPDGKRVRGGQWDPAPRIFRAGGGLYSTAADYLRFSQMLLNGGQLDGRRVLSRKSVELMTMRQVDSLPPPFSPGQYFGLGVGVQSPEGESRLLLSPESCWWGGVASTTFFVDPKEELVAVLMAQQLPTQFDLTAGFWNAVEQAVDD